MQKMKELYEKVAADSALQLKFAEIMKEAEAVGEEATKEKLITFAKETGYDVTMGEMQTFFKGLAETGLNELSNAELDMVAGGKTQGELLVSLASLGFSCVVGSMVASERRMTCKEYIHGLMDEEIF